MSAALYGTTPPELTANNTRRCGETLAEWKKELPPLSARSLLEGSQLRKNALHTEAQSVEMKKLKKSVGQIN